MEIDAVVAGLSALAQPARLAIFRVLVAAGPAGLAVGAIAQQIAIPPTTLSFHLAQLKNAGLVGVTRRSRHLIYAADTARMTALIAYLTETCCNGDPAACGFVGPQSSPQPPHSDSSS